MSETLEDFTRWDKKPLNVLYDYTDAGFPILMITLPLLERYLRQKSGVCEETETRRRSLPCCSH